MTNDTAPLIAIIGRPNVGKSTLFNRILGAPSAIVDDVPGVTRDRNYADGLYRGRPFRLVDTGGLDPSATEGMLALVRRQSQIAIAEADVLIFLMDGRIGLTPTDHEIASLLRGVRKPVFFTINKLDTPESEPLLADFYRLWQDTLYPLSSEHGLGVNGHIFPPSRCGRRPAERGQVHGEQHPSWPGTAAGQRISWYDARSRRYDGELRRTELCVR